MAVLALGGIDATTSIPVNGQWCDSLVVVDCARTAIRTIASGWCSVPRPKIGSAVSDRKYPFRVASNAAAMSPPVDDSAVACSCDGHDETFQFSKCEEPFNHPLPGSLLEF